MEINCSIFVVKKQRLALNIFGLKVDLQFTYIFFTIKLGPVQFNVHV